MAGELSGSLGDAEGVARALRHEARSVWYEGDSVAALGCIDAAIAGLESEPGSNGERA
jgi:hypothetical protein